ncbi:MAG: response regulator [Mariprofundales bacterium]|nr:response regulator [Mariprofundales bacterium]
MNPLILLVDDDALFCTLLTRAFAQRHLHCMAAQSTDTATELIDQNHFSHAVIDLNLGAGMSGLGVLRHLIAVQPKCRALILTGFASIATAVEATQIGAVQYLPKPATVDEVIAALGRRGTHGKDRAEPQIEPEISAHPLSPKRLEWEYIQRTLMKNRGNISATALELGMHRRTLQRKLAKSPPRR